MESTHKGMFKGAEDDGFINEGAFQLPKEEVADEAGVVDSEFPSAVTPEFYLLPEESNNIPPGASSD